MDGHLSDPWGNHVYSANREMQVTEIWTNQHVRSGVVHRAASLDTQGRWAYLGSTTNQTGPCCTRIYWMRNTPHGNHTELDIAEDVLARAVQESQLEQTFSGYRNCYTGAFDCSLGASSDQKAYCFSYHPKLAMSWRTDISTGLTSCIILATEPQLKKLQKLAETIWHPWRHAMAPAYLMACLLRSEVDDIHRKLKDSIRAVEGQTKHHAFQKRPEIAPISDWGKLSAEMSGCETKLASTTRKIEALKHLLSFMQATCRNQNSTSGSQNAADDSSGILALKIVEMQQLLELCSVDNQYTLERARVQRSAIFSIIAQKDASGGIDIAQQSYIIALHAQRNAAAMKTLAVVTMIFLPGTFLAAVFSMPLFDWTANNGVILPRFKIFWAIALPLTMVTLVTYWLWSWWDARQNMYQVQRDVEKIGESGSTYRRTFTDATVRTA